VVNSESVSSNSTDPLAIAVTLQDTKLWLPLLLGVILGAISVFLCFKLIGVFWRATKGNGCPRPKHRAQLTTVVGAILGVAFSSFLTATIASTAPLLPRVYIAVLSGIITLILAVIGPLFAYELAMHPDQMIEINSRFRFWKCLRPFTGVDFEYKSGTGNVFMVSLTIYWTIRKRILSPPSTEVCDSKEVVPSQ